MGQGYWLKLGDGTYKHYTEEEYANLIKRGLILWAKIIGGIIICMIVLFICLISL